MEEEYESVMDSVVPPGKALLEGMGAMVVVKRTPTRVGGTEEDSPPCGGFLVGLARSRCGFLGADASATATTIEAITRMTKRSELVILLIIVLSSRFYNLQQKQTQCA